jgi:hypothetical protein
MWLVRVASPADVSVAGRSLASVAWSAGGFGISKEVARGTGGIAGLHDEPVRLLNPRCRHLCSASSGPNPKLGAPRGARRLPLRGTFGGLRGALPGYWLRGAGDGLALSAVSGIDDVQEVKGPGIRFTEQTRRVVAGHPLSCGGLRLVASQSAAAPRRRPRGGPGRRRWRVPGWRVPAAGGAPGSGSGCGGRLSA